MIGRERELNELGAVAALRSVENERGERIREEPAPLVVVYGGASTGKSMCVAQALRRHAELYAMVDCTAIYSAQEFYREILVQLYKNQSGSSRHATELHAGASANDAGANGGEKEEQLTIEDEQEVVEEARANAKKKRGDDAEHASGDSDHEDEEEHDDGDSSGGSEDDDDDEEEQKGRRQSDSKRQSAISRAKRLRARQREQQQQKDAEAQDAHVTYEGYNSLNFLSFIKALGIFMDFAANKASNDDPSDEQADNGHGAEDEERQQQQVTKRVVYLALDQVDKLLDRGLAPLLTCIFTVNEQLAYLNMFSGVQWDVSVLLITRAMSLEFDHLVSAFFPAYIPFSPYTSEQVADILVDQLRMHPVARIFRKWLLHLSSLVPASQDDWLEFRRNVVHLLPDFKSYFSLVTAASATAPVPALGFRDTPSKTAEKQLKKLMRATNDRVAAFQKTRRKHLFGYDKLQRSSGDPTDTISCTDLSRSCLLLVIAGYLASFNPQDTDTNFLSSSGGVRRKKRVKKTGQSSAAAAEQISQLLIGPRIFTLQRLLAIYLNLRVEASADLNDRFIVNEAREDIFTHMATLVRMQLFQRTSPPNMLDDIKFRCLADSRFVQETARYLRFPLESYLNTAT